MRITNKMVNIIVKKHNTTINKNKIRRLMVRVLGIPDLYSYLESNIDYFLYELLYTSLNSNSVHDL